MAKIELKNQIRRLRFDHDEMTQHKLANRVKVTRQTIIALEANKYAPSLPLAFRIARVFGVSVEEVFQFESALLIAKSDRRHQRGQTTTVLFEEFIENKNFSEQTRQALSLAEHEARHYQHQYLGTEHLLLGVVCSASGRMEELLKNLGVDMHRVRVAFEKRLLKGQDKSEHKLPLMPRALTALNFALEKAGTREVTPEDLMLGLLQDKEAMSGTILRDLEVDTYDFARQLS